jgi:hypothetical protein
VEELDEGGEIVKEEMEKRRKKGRQRTDLKVADVTQG